MAGRNILQLRGAKSCTMTLNTFDDASRLSLTINFQKPLPFHGKHSSRCIRVRLSSQP